MIWTEIENFWGAERDEHLNDSEEGILGQKAALKMLVW